MAEQDPEGLAAARPLLTDLYQATMALGYWRAGRAQDLAEFELFFRHCPFGGAFALAAGLRDCVRFLRTFHLRDAGTAYFIARHPAPRQAPPAREAPHPQQDPGEPFPCLNEPPNFPRPPPPAPAPECRCRPQMCSSWPRCCLQTLTPRSSSTSGPLTAPG